MDELSVEIANNNEMYDFVRLKKEIYAAFLDLSRSLVYPILLYTILLFYRSKE